MKVILRTEPNVKDTKPIKVNFTAETTIAEVLETAEKKLGINRKDVNIISCNTTGVPNKQDRLDVPLGLCGWFENGTNKITIILKKSK